MAFEAQYDSGTCTSCGSSIEAGEQIETSAMGRITRYEHVRCPVTCSICGGNWQYCGCP